VSSNRSSKGLIVFFSIFLFIGLVTKWEASRFYSNSFGGDIEKIEFTAKRIIVIFVNGDDYYLDHYERSIGSYLEVGDSVHKAEETWELHVFKKKEGRVVSESVWYRRKD